MASDRSNSGALFELSGTVPTNATWSEDIYFREGAAGMDISDLDWKMSFRSDACSTSPAYELSTDAGTLSIVDDDASVPSILRILVPAGTLNTYRGDYICDLASRDADDKVDLWAHGIVSFRNNPTSWT